MLGAGAVATLDGEGKRAMIHLVQPYTRRFVARALLQIKTTRPSTVTTRSPALMPKVHGHLYDGRW